MIDETIIHHKILEKLGERGLALRFILRSFSEGGSPFKFGNNL